MNSLPNAQTSWRYIRHVYWLTSGILLALPLNLTAQQFTILRAVYAGGDVQRDVTALVQAQEKNGTVQLDVRNGTLGGDPAFGKVKTLTVLYQTAAGDFTVTAREGEKLVLPNANAALVQSGNAAIANSSPPASLRHLAPDGVYYLLQRVSAITDSGVTSFPPGTQVRRVSETNGIITAKAGNDQFDVQKRLVTNDLDVAAQVASEYAAEVAGIQAEIASENQRMAQEQQAQQTAQATANERARRQKVDQHRLAAQRARGAQQRANQTSSGSVTITVYGLSGENASLHDVGGGQ